MSNELPPSETDTNELLERAESWQHALPIEGSDALTAALDALVAERDAALARAERLDDDFARELARCETAEAALVAVREERDALRAERARFGIPALLARSLSKAVAERDTLREANHRLMRINGGLRGRAAGEENDHYCAVEGCNEPPVIYEFASDEFVCSEHIYYGAEKPWLADLEAAERERDTLREALGEIDHIASQRRIGGPRMDGSVTYSSPYFGEIRNIACRALAAGVVRPGEPE